MGGTSHISRNGPFHTAALILSAKHNACPIVPDSNLHHSQNTIEYNLQLHQTNKPTNQPTNQPLFKLPLLEDLPTNQSQMGSPVGAPYKSRPAQALDKIPLLNQKE
jgi:hypothetical protein